MMIYWTWNSEQAVGSFTIFISTSFQLPVVISGMVVQILLIYFFWMFMTELFMYWSHYKNDK